MFKVTKKPTYRWTGALCLIVFGMTIISCQQKPVAPQAHPNAGYGIANTHTDSLRVQDDQPPKDVGDGGKGK